MGLTMAASFTAALMVFMAVMWTVNESVLTDPGSSDQEREQARQWKGRFSALTGAAGMMSLLCFIAARGL